MQQPPPPHSRKSSESSSLLLLLLLLSLSIITQQQTQCNDDLCLVCGSVASNCLTCKSTQYIFLSTPSEGCLPCPIQCQTCTSQTDQISCLQCSTTYYEDPTTTSTNSNGSQSITCLKCPTSNCLSCEPYQPNHCITCDSGYYLQESTKTCRSCPNNYLNSQTCRQNFITTCQAGYFTQNGDECLTCPQNCITCASQTICQQCLQGYFASSVNGSCVQCDQTCSQCKNNLSCSDCPQMYKISSSTGFCEPCSTANCLECNFLNSCLQCEEGYYLDSTLNTCSPLSNSQQIPKCLHAQIISTPTSDNISASQITCVSCISGFYINYDFNSCQPCSILCSECSNYHRVSTCLKCNEAIAFHLDEGNGFCSPRTYYEESYAGGSNDDVSGGGNSNSEDNNRKIVYKSKRNDASSDYEYIGNTIVLSIESKQCPTGKVSESVSINVEIHSGYEFEMIFKFNLKALSTETHQLLENGSQTVIITVLLNNFTIASSIEIEEVYACGSTLIGQSEVKFDNLENIIKNGQIEQNTNRLTFSATTINSLQQIETILIDIEQLVIFFKQCHSSCLSCLTYNQCIQCPSLSQTTTASTNDNTYRLQSHQCLTQCSSLHFLLPTSNPLQCIQNCPSGTYPNIQSIEWTCEQCPYQCETCTSLQQCTSCKEGFYLDLYSKQLISNSSRCVSTCPDKFYNENLTRKCEKCISPCNLCLSARKCLNCIRNYFNPLDFSCVDTCPNGYYGSLTELKCVECVSPCHTCQTQNYCLSCQASNLSTNDSSINNITSIQTLAFYQGTCISVCPFGYAKTQTTTTSQSLSNDDQNINNDDDNTYSPQYNCQQCHFPCLDCQSSPTNCTKCITGYLLSENNTCLDTCPDLYYKSLTFLQCRSCSSECFTCEQSPNNCKSCHSGYLYNAEQGTCNEESTGCQIGFYADLQVMECIRCHQFCAECYNATSNTCSACTEGYWLMQTDTECLYDCGVGYFENLTSKKCDPCAEGCQECIYQAEYCLSCSENYTMLYNNTCSSLCDQTELWPGCEPCLYPCYSCQNNTFTCTSCQKDYYLVQELSQCVSECPYGSYKTSQQGFGICTKCPEPCIHCFNDKICLECGQIDNNTWYYLEVNSQQATKECVSQCNQYNYLYVANQQTNNNDNQVVGPGYCLPCEQPCLKCSSADVCTQCINGVLTEDGKCNSKLVGCPLGEYVLVENDGSEVCKFCPSECLTCLSETVCESCQENFYLYNASCISFCPSGTARIAQTRKCVTCQYPCQQCFDSSTNCTKCHHITLHVDKILSSTVCPSHRQSTDPSTGQPICIKYYLEEGTCLSECSSVTYPSGFNCLPCPTECITCTSETTCTSCSEGNFLLGAQCYIGSCPDGYYGNIGENTCEECLYPCQKCLNSTFCVRCEEGYLFEGACLVQEDCPAGNLPTYSDQKGSFCQQCDSQCLVCVSEANFCVECATLSLFQGDCVQTCPQGYFNHITTSSYFPSTQYPNISQCLKCPQQCLTCSNLITCQSCKYSYFLLNNSCVSTCPPNYYEKTHLIDMSLGESTTQQTLSTSTTAFYYESQQCIICLSPCATCSSSDTSCDTCMDGYFLHLRQCINLCPLETYANPITKKCEDCPFPCFNCYLNIDLNNSNTLLTVSSDDFVCTQCRTGSYLDGDQCQNSCKGKYIATDGSTCLTQCPNEQYSTNLSHLGIQPFCSNQCDLPYISKITTQVSLTNDNNNTSNTSLKQCVTECSQGDYNFIEYYVDASLTCQINNQTVSSSSVSSTTQSLLQQQQNPPQASTHLYVDLMNILTLRMEFNTEMEYRMPRLSEDMFEVTLYRPMLNEQFLLGKYSSINDDVGDSERLKVNQLGKATNHNRRNLQYVPTEQTSQPIITQIAISTQTSKFLQLKLFPSNHHSIPSHSILALKIQNNLQYLIVDSLSKIPIQQSQFSIEFQDNYFQTYTYDQLTTRFQYIGEIMINFVLIIGLIILVFNRFAKIYQLLLYMQSLWILLILDISLPPNLSRFLQGFKYTYFYQIPNVFITEGDDSMERIASYSSSQQNQNFNRIQSILGDGNFIRLTGHLIVLYSSVTIIVLILFLTRFIPKSSNETATEILQKCAHKVKLMKWSHLSDLFYSTSMLIFFGFFIQIQNTNSPTTSSSSSSNTTNIYQLFGIILSLIFMLIMSGFALYIIYKTKKMKQLATSNTNKSNKKDYMYRQEYISFYEGINSFQNLYKNYLIVLKIIIYTVFCGLFYRQPGLCLSVLICMQVSYGLIHFLKQPYSDRTQNNLLFLSNLSKALGMLFMMVIQYLGGRMKNQYFGSSDAMRTIQNQKITLGYLAIVCFLIGIGVLTIELITSIMRGNLKKKVLDGEVQEKQVMNLKLLLNQKYQQQNAKGAPNKLYFEEKNNFTAYGGYSQKHSQSEQYEQESSQNDGYYNENNGYREQEEESGYRNDDGSEIESH